MKLGWRRKRAEAMTATFTCPNCGRSGTRRKDTARGQLLRCPQCKNVFAPVPVSTKTPVNETEGSVKPPRKKRTYREALGFG